jgi:hypothetical protein
MSTEYAVPASTTRNKKTMRWSLRALVVPVMLLCAGQSCSAAGVSVVHISMYQDIPVFLMSDGTVRVLRRPFDLKYPVSIAGLHDVLAIAGSLALKRDGTVWQWDVDRKSVKVDRDQIRFTVAFLPAKKIDGVDHVKAIAAGFNFGLALKADGHVWGWGDDRLGRLGMTEEQAAPPHGHGPNSISGPEDFRL